jgi:hypothetical protein
MYFILILAALLNYSVGIDMYRQTLDKWWNKTLSVIGFIPGVGLLFLASYFVELGFRAFDGVYKNYFTLIAFLMLSLGSFSQIPADPICSCPFPGKDQTVNLPIANHADRILQALHYLYGTDKSTLAERAIWSMVEKLDDSERIKLRQWFKKNYPTDYKVYAKGMLNQYDFWIKAQKEESKILINQ